MGKTKKELRTALSYAEGVSARRLARIYVVAGERDALREQLDEAKRWKVPAPRTIKLGPGKMFIDGVEVGDIDGGSLRVGSASERKLLKDLEAMTKERDALQKQLDEAKRWKGHPVIIEAKDTSRTITLPPSAPGDIEYTVTLDSGTVSVDGSDFVKACETQAEFVAMKEALEAMTADRDEWRTCARIADETADIWRARMLDARDILDGE